MIRDEGENKKTKRDKLHEKKPIARILEYSAASVAVMALLATMIFIFPYWKAPNSSASPIVSATSTLQKNYPKQLLLAKKWAFPVRGSKAIRSYRALPTAFKPL